MASFCFAGPLSAQIVQYGNVVLMNSGGKSLPDVSITIASVHDCQPTKSDANGRFRLNFSEHKAGDVIYGLKVMKNGYELVNRHVVREGFTLTDKNPLKVVMASSKEINEARMRYYFMLEEASVNRYDTTMAFLDQQFAQQRITETEKEYWKMQAETELKNAYQHLDDYADRLACVNKDDLTDEALILYDNMVQGKTDDALALIDEEPQTSVIESYLAFSGAYPMEEPEVSVAEGLYDLMDIPDSLYSDVVTLDYFNHQYEKEFSVNGPRYAKCCYYLGTLLQKSGEGFSAISCYQKALKMYEMLEMMGAGDYRKQIDELKALLGME